MTGRLPEVAVIGAGAAGLAAAADLAEAGCAVTVIEKDSIASASSGLSAGVYSEGTYTDPLNIAMRSYAVARLRKMRESHGLPLNEVGFLRLARGEEVLDGYRAGLALQREANVLDSVVVDREGLEAIVPGMNCDVFAGGLWAPRDGYLDGPQLAAVYATRAKAAGAELRLRTELRGAGVTPGGRLRLDTSQGVVKADFVVNAAGSWADRVGDMLGAPVEIIAQRHQICVVSTSTPFGFTLPEVMDNVPGTGENGLWFRQERADQFLAGLHSNDVVTGEDRENPDDYEHGLDDEYVADLIELLLERLPEFDMSLHSGWSGLYPLSPTGSFVIGPDGPNGRVIQAAGTGGVGVNVSPAIGRLVSDWIVSAAPSIPGTEVLAPSASATPASTLRTNTQ